MSLHHPAWAALSTACLIMLSNASVAQTPRATLDARAMAPGLQPAPEPAPIAKPATGLTRNQRQEAALQARQDGALAPAGEAADPRNDRPAVPPARNRLAVATPPAPPAPTAAVAPAPAPMPPTVVASTTPPPPPPKKRVTRKPATPSAAVEGRAIAVAPQRARTTAKARAASAPA